MSQEHIDYSKLVPSSLPADTGPQITVSHAFTQLLKHS